MNTYTFSTINDKDFEILALDLLNEEFKLNLQDFKVGRDAGIDLRYSTTTNKNSIVVQAKHYLKTDFKSLIRILKKDELPKVKLLKPDRYLIVTSLELSAKEKNEIKDVFTPYISTENDVFGNQDLNRLLRKHKDIEKRHFKLWFSSTEVISNILNNAVEGRTKNYLKRIKDKIPLYVLTKNFDEANRKLSKEKILLITGQPGVGKTTLAEALLYERAKKKFQIYLINTIREAEDVISLDDKKKQVFYFDDFLGEVYYEIIAGSQKESEIASFVDRIKHTPNKFIILSTRTVILEQAKLKSEKIKRSRIETGKYEVVLDSYTRYEKAKILYNHLFFNNLNKNFFEAIIANKFYMWIIEHYNYTPRLIEFLTYNDRIKNFTKAEYVNFVSKNLTHPEEIWSDSFHNQIDYFDRCLLYTLFTFQKGVPESLLLRAYNKRLKFEKKINNKQISSEQFNKSVKSLLNGFITSNIIHVDKKIKQYNFINPSISDFVISNLNENFSAKKAILESIVYIEQLEIFNPEKNNFTIELELQNMILHNIENNLYDSLNEYKEYQFTGQQLEIVIKYCPNTDIDNVVLKLLKEINLEKMWWIRKNFEYLLDNLGLISQSAMYLKKNFLIYMNPYIDQIDDKEQALKIPTFFKKIGRSFNFYKNKVVNQNKIIDLITKISFDKEKDLMETFKDNVTKWDDYDSLVYNEIREMQNQLSSILLIKEINVDFPNFYDKLKLDEQILINTKEKKDSLKRERSVNNLYTKITEQRKLENTKITDLFYFNQV
jgi:KaiC/GvpD/RAD55 family RecA-like ATPase/transposase-like protein